MKKIKCLFLGYNSKQTKLISFLNNKKINVFQKRNYKVNSKIINKYDVCICYGYRKILNQSILKKLNRNETILLLIFYVLSGFKINAEGNLFFISIRARSASKRELKFPTHTL